MIKKIAILCSIFLNLCIVRWEPVAIRMTWEAVGRQTFTFYTENSNVFAFFVCLLVAVCQVICLFTGRQLPRWVKTLKYIATCCLTMTFLTVVFVLGPYCADQGGVVFLLTESSMLYHHLNLLCRKLIQDGQLPPETVSLQTLEPFPSLTLEERTRFSECFSGLGRLEAEQECRRLELYQAQFQAALQEGEAAARTQSMLSHKLGLAAGLAAAILLG